MMWRSARWFSMFVATLGLAGSWASAQSTAPRFAPGVLTVIPSDVQYAETYSGPMPLVEIVKGLPQLDWTPNYAAKSRTIYERAKLVSLRRVIWNFEFAFKPLRMIEVDVPQVSGKMQRKRIWYLVYRIRYLGGDMQPDEKKDTWGHITYDAKPVSYEGRFFFPQFFLESHEFNKTYQDRIIPAAREPIQKKELDGRRLLNSVEISGKPIPLSTPEESKPVWGVATWEDIDPRIDFFSVYVKGLTNAYKPVDLPDGFKPGDPPGTGRQLLSKTLRLNFWRPGDAVLEHEEEIQYGVPYDSDPQRQAEILTKFGLHKRVDYSWVYR